MRENLAQYVTLLFAGIPDGEDMRQEILQNTLDRYDDLIAQGKSPEAAYRLAIAGIGDINEILGQEAPAGPNRGHAAQEHHPENAEDAQEQERKKKRSLAIAIYIASPIPLILLSELGQDTLGLCFTLLLVAAATWAMILNKAPEKPKPEGTWENREAPASPRKELDKSLGSILWAVGIALYLMVSFATGAWYITWVIFLIVPTLHGLIRAILDLREAN